MAKPIHSMIRVLDEARSVDFYRRAFGMGVADRYDFDGFTLVYLKAEESPFELELTINHGRTEPYALGDAYGHIAVAVEDLPAEEVALRLKCSKATVRSHIANARVKMLGYMERKEI